MRLHPVLMPIPQEEEARTPPQVREQRAYARRALRACARYCGAPENGWEKDGNEAPLPQAGHYWSVSHKRRWAAAVIADRPVGIDLEQIAPRRVDLYEALADDEEWKILGDRGWPSFFRLWTAKEATLKAHGVGIAGFSACRLVEVPDITHMMLEYEGRTWRVEHYYHAGHVAAVTCGADPVEWHIEEDV